MTRYPQRVISCCVIVLLATKAVALVKGKPELDVARVTSEINLCSERCSCVFERIE